MARTRKYTQPLNLYKYDVLIEDKGTRSDYFKITQFDGYFYGGRNAFLIAGTSVLKPNSNILVEILNTDGGTVYSAPVTNFIEGGSRLIQVEVYDDTPPGPAKLVILGCTETYLDGTEVPLEWKNKYNVRWIVDVIISPNVKNKTPIRFINTPGVQVEEKYYPSLLSSSFSQSIQVPYGDYEITPITYNIFQNGYAIKLKTPTENNVFKSEYVNGTLNVNVKFKNSPVFVTASLPITKIYNSTTLESRGVLASGSDNTVITYALISGSGTNYVSPIYPYGDIEIESSSAFIRYDKVIPSDINTSLSSYAKLRLFNLNTISGEVNKIRISYKPTTEQGEYIVLGDIPAQVQELLSVDSGSKVINTGKFNEISVNEYWYAATMSAAKGDDSATLPSYYTSASLYTNLQVIQNSDTLIDAIFVNPPIENNAFKDNISYFIGTNNNNHFTLFPNSEYTLKFNATAATTSGSETLNQKDYTLEVYLIEPESGSGKIIDTNSKGQLIGTLNSSGTKANQLFENTEFNFIPKIVQESQLALRFVIYGGFWNIADVSLKPAEEQFFSPDEVNALIQNVNFTDKLLTFKTEYLDINNNSVATSVISQPTYFTGSVSLINSFAVSASYATTASYVSNPAFFNELATIFYVTQEGSDSNDGRTIGSAFRTIKRACQAASDYITANPGPPLTRVSIQVKTGYYEEEAPITVPRNTSILGDDLRTVLVRPTTLTKNENLFLMNNATYAWGLRLEGCEIDDLTDPRKGFFFAFAPSASIVTSPYVQNCTANHTPPDKFYVPMDYTTGNPQVGNGPGGMIVDDSVLDGYSPLKSMIVDAYTQVGFNGIGICVRGAGYAQMVSFFTNFSHIGTWAIGGGHISLLNSNTTFGDYGLRSTGKRMIVTPNISAVSEESSSAASSLILAEKTSIQNYMIDQLKLSGSFSASYADTNSAVYASTIKDSGILIDSIVSDLLGKVPGRTAQFTQGLFKGQDTSLGKIYTLPSASGFTTGAIPVFRVNDIFRYNQMSCSRDVGYILDAYATDVLYGGNQRSVTAGIFYYKYPSQATTVQLDKTLSGSRFATTKSLALTTVGSDEYKSIFSGSRYLLDIIANGLGSVPVIVSNTDGNIKVTGNSTVAATIPATDAITGSISSSFAIVNTIIENGLGAAPTLIPRSAASTDATVLASYNALHNTTNVTFIQEETIAYLSASWNGFQYDSTKCKRDIGYIISGAAEDLLYSSNSSSIVNGSFYYTIPSTVTTTQLNPTLDAINYASKLAQKIITNTTFVPTSSAASTVFNSIRSARSGIQEQTIEYINDALVFDFIRSWKYIKNYIINDPDAKFGTLSAGIKTKIGQLIDIPIDTITSVVVNLEPTLLQEFGSLVTSTSHDFSYAGSGVNFLALPANQRGIGQPNIDIRVFEEDGGRVYHTSGDETGDFYTGQDFVIRQATGVIEGRTFNKAIVARFTPLNLVLSD